MSFHRDQRPTVRVSTWCPACPTRVTVESDEPRYARQERFGEPWPSVDTCPACGTALVRLDSMLGVEVPYIVGADNAMQDHPSSWATRAHAAWLGGRR